MMAALKAHGFTLEELGELPPQSWVDLYGAVMYDRYWQLATLMNALHPKHPQETQRRLLRAARASLARGTDERKPVWADPARFKALLGGVPGVQVREGHSEPPRGSEGVPGEGQDPEEGQREEGAQAERPVPPTGAEAPEAGSEGVGD